MARGIWQSKMGNRAYDGGRDDHSLIMIARTNGFKSYPPSMPHWMQTGAIMLKRDPNCTLCKLHQTAEFVCLLGQGPKQCDVMVIGEAPGKREDASGKAFVGRSGQYLEEVLAEYGFARRNIYITNAVHCRPPDNRTPRKSEIAACRHWLEKEIAAVKPKYVLLLGNVPLQAITGKGGIKRRRGRPFEKDGCIYLPTYHPAYILRNPNQDWLFRGDIRAFQGIVTGKGLPREKRLSFEIVDTREKVDKFIKDLLASTIISYDIETNCLYPWRSKEVVKGKKGGILARPDPKINTIGFGTKHHQWILPIRHDESPWSDADIDTILKRIDGAIRGAKIVCHNGKFDLLWTWVHFELNWAEVFDFDTMLAHYILDENDLHDLKRLAQRLCNAPDWDIDKDQKQGAASLQKLGHYQAHDLFYTRELRFKLRKKLREDGDVELVFDEIMMACARLFVEVEYDGVCVDTSKMDDAERFLLAKRNDAEKEMKKFGDLDNWGSRDQLATLLFGPKRDGGLGIPVVEKTPSGKAGTSESVLKRIDHPIAGAILKYREAQQQLSFFIDGWKPFMQNRRGAVYLHPSFKLHGTVTGRLSCEHPNLQQVPRDERIRSLIVAPPGWELVECDLSQIELRIAAELANERTMLEYFRTGVDVHWATALREIARGGGQRELVLDTARKVVGKKLAYNEAIEKLLEMGADAAVDIRKEWKELRKKAKAVNFGYLYGMWWKKFKIYARDNYDIQVSDEEAEASREFFFDTFHDFPAWHERQRRYVRRNGYVRTLSGRKRRLPDAMLDDKWARQEAERQAINSPVQSFANEINLMAAIQLRREFGRDVARIVGTVHDSILLWVKKDKVDEVTDRLLQIMTRPKLFDKFEVELGVPVLAEAKIGAWGKGISFKRWREQNGNERKSRKARLLRQRTPGRANVHSTRTRSVGSSPRSRVG